VIEEGGVVTAFLLVLQQGTAYDSVNYQWFEKHYEKFLYIDRVVVSKTHQGRGLGHRLYADLFAFAKQIGMPLITAEFDLDPPNEGSRKFHESYGFSEMGRQVVPYGNKKVSLQAVVVMLGK
jgi:uncharacterized protein